MSDKKIIGYFKPFDHSEKEIKHSPMLVGCKRCNKTWFEDWIDTGWRKNSAHMCYDWCSECKTDKDQP